MTTTITRRGLLRGTMAAALAAPLARLAVSDAGAATTRAVLSYTALADDLGVVSGAGVNIVIARAAQDLLLVDGGNPAQSRDLLRLIAREFKGARVATVFNTHWHWDQTGSNEPLAKAGATLVAHENTRLWLGTPVNSAWEGRIYAPLPVKAQPNQTFFYGSKTLTFGAQDLQYALLVQAHTDGDIYVRFPRQNVIAAGGVVTDNVYPILDYSTNGWLGGMVTGLKTLMDLCDDATRVVPASGAVRGKADLKAQQDMCFTVLQRIGESYYKGQTWDEFLASKPTREFDERYGDPDLFLRTAYRGAWEHINEIRRVTR